MKTKIENLIETGTLITEIAYQARDNESFKEKLIKEPHQAIDEYVGRQEVFAKNENIVVNEPNSDEVYLVIPRKVELDDIELSDIELESLSGGTDIFTGIALGVLAIATGYAFAQL